MAALSGATRAAVVDDSDPRAFFGRIGYEGLDVGFAAAEVEETLEVQLQLIRTGVGRVGLNNTLNDVTAKLTISTSEFGTVLGSVL